MCIGHFVLRSTNRNEMSKDLVELVKAMAKEMGVDLAELGPDDVVVLTEDSFEKEEGQDSGAPRRVLRCLLRRFMSYGVISVDLALNAVCVAVSPFGFADGNLVLFLTVMGYILFDHLGTEWYGVSGYPILKFFPKSSKVGEDYGGGRDLDDLTFINEKCGTSRDGNGDLLQKLAGIVATLENLVKEFITVGNDEKKAIVARMEEEVENLKGTTSRYGKIYLKAVNNCVEKSAEYPKKEIQRLERMLEKSISEVEADEFTLKKNILATFA
ncbi:hypothetical protein GH714_006112 [Hevea brasiliensis]|uniref:protein disulfide-isomerase n=1 Tax=Hevea brasiliensis TaxID=3981 RepID=A0A6A6NFS5_HEVBR|nr:hypothetical protein GH714_006112 [Hevea brasiliensis]